MMAGKKGGDSCLTWPPDFNEIRKRLHKEEMRSWLKPKSGDLLRDVTYLHDRAAKEKNRTIRGIYLNSAREALADLGKDLFFGGVDLGHDGGAFRLQFFVVVLVLDGPEIDFHVELGATYPGRRH